MNSNERLIAALNKTIEINKEIELGKFIRYIGSVSELAYMSDDELALQIENYNSIAEDLKNQNSNPYNYCFKPTDVYTVDCDYDSTTHDFSKENEQIAYDRYVEKNIGKIFFEFEERVNCSEFLRRFVLEFIEPDDYKDFTIINHQDMFWDWFPMEYRHMNAYVICRKGEKYVAKHAYVVKNPCFGELFIELAFSFIDDFDECFAVAIDWAGSPRFTDYTQHIMYGLNYKNGEKIIEVYNEQQTIEKFHEYMQKANKIISTWKGVLYDDGTI